MKNLLISKSDPMSFMGLINASPLDQKKRQPLYGLINAGLISLFLGVAISHMAQAAEAEESTIQSESRAAICHLEACNMV